MRVVGGEAKGRKLVAPTGRDTRPTSDRAREAVFNMLASLRVVDGAQVADLFAGSGAMGIEALSRGAARATFVERDGAAVRAIEANLQATGLSERATVVRGDATAPVGRMDVVFADPPYAFAAWTELLDQLDAAIAVLESDREIDVGAKWLVNKVRRYGSTVVTLAQRKGTT
ncbi:MAG: 16S rRNA (guanine(966)-N(2))-methyltransferase RsmD [Actinobacteria bacterium]|nr:16S rRNA (guanine(966)-N(2))-methyltransferase RsmD [Actinomycetota bacterium]